MHFDGDKRKKYTIFEEILTPPKFIFDVRLWTQTG